MILPQFVTEKLQPKLKVIWWGRRARYEIVEEFSEAIFRVWIIVSIAYDIESNLGLGNIQPFNYWLVVFIVCLFAAHHAVVEYYSWRNEVYVVAKDEANGGGRVYKFYGWLSKKHLDEPITPASPTLMYDQFWFYRLWGKLTGEQMVKISLKSMNHTFLDGQRISPQFEKAIQKVRGSKGSAQDEMPPNELRNLEEIKQAFIDGLIDKKLAENAAETIIRRVVYGQQ